MRPLIGRAPGQFLGGKSGELGWDRFRYLSGLLYKSSRDLLKPGAIAMVIILADVWWHSALSTVIGGFLAIAGGGFVQWLSWQKERKSVAAAFAAEVQGILDLFDWRRIIEKLPEGWKFAVEPNFPIFESHIGKIGLLPTDLAAKITVFL